MGLPETFKIKSHILSTIQRDYADDPFAWIARAIFYSKNSKCMSAFRHVDEQPQANRRKCTPETPAYTDSALDANRDDCSTVRTEEMILHAVRFLQDYACRVGEEEEKSSHDDECVEGSTIVAEQISATHALVREPMLLEAALSSDSYSSALALQHANYLVGQLVNAAAIAVLQQFVENVTD